MHGQYVDGLRTPFILHAPNETTTWNYSQEYVVGLSDWYHAEHKPLLDHYLSVFNPSGAEPIPDAPLINEIQNQEYTFVPGTTYRLRFIGMTALSMFYVWIDGHKMHVIEVDGIDVAPYEVDALPVASAQRYSVLVTAKVLGFDKERDRFQLQPERSL
jgi:iron transport multicopper oxidase